jgi:hypothetical protein
MRESYDPEPGSPQPGTDDLRKIAGIGPVLARRLGEVGVASYRDLASLTPERIADVLTDIIGVSPERITSQDWIGQARRLAENASTEPAGHQRYATFHIELLIDTDNRIRRTKVRHYQTDTEANWPGWDDKQLITLIQDKARLDTGPPHQAEAQPQQASPIHIDGLGPAETGTRGIFRHAGQPTTVCMTLRVSPIRGADGDAVDFSAEIAARTVGSRNRHPVAKTNGTITIDHATCLELAGPPLPPGMHILEAEVVVHAHNHQPDEQSLCRHQALGHLINVAGEHPRSQDG